MKYELIARKVLRQFKIGKCYSGYDYIIHAIGLMFFDERFFHCLTKVLYATIAENYNTSPSCVEKNIRKVIQTIWNNPNNEELIKIFFGPHYIHIKPSNKEFLGLLYEYAKSCNILEELFCVNKFACPISHESCGVYESIIELLSKL